MKYNINTHTISTHSIKLNISKLKVSVFSALTAVLVLSSLWFSGIQQANAAITSTIVTDAIGTQEVWTFNEIRGVKKLVSRINQVDGKGIYKT